MSTTFEKYNDIILDAFQTYQRGDDLCIKKRDIIDQIIKFYGLKPVNILFVGFSPAILKFSDVNLYLSDVSDTVAEYLEKNGVKFQRVDLNNVESDMFDITVAMDEYYTFAESDSEQRSLVTKMVDITNHVIITSLRDYKNQDHREREFSYPVCIRNLASKKIFFEGYDYDPVDRNVFYGTNYIIDDEGIMTAGSFVRRAMFFKQLAKFSIDAGANNFTVHKNIVYKNLIKKNYEHLITIKV